MAFGRVLEGEGSDMETFTDRRDGWDWDGAQAMLAGALVRIAGPVLTQFHSDLYRDCQLVMGMSEKDHDLVYVVREWGTHLYLTTEGESLVATTEKMHGWHSTWHVGVRKEGRDTWLLTASQVRMNDVATVA